MDDNTRSHIKEELGLALGHLYSAHGLVPDFSSGLGLDLAIIYAKVEHLLNSLTKEVQSGR